nr:hypothetical protein CFP56_10372 [Quercus suber]
MRTLALLAVLATVCAAAPFLPSGLISVGASSLPMPTGSGLPIPSGYLTPTMGLLSADTKQPSPSGLLIEKRGLPGTATAPSFSAPTFGYPVPTGYLVARDYTIPSSGLPSTVRATGVRSFSFPTSGFVSTIHLAARDTSTPSATAFPTGTLAARGHSLPSHILPSGVSALLPTATGY